MATNKSLKFSQRADFLKLNDTTLGNFKSFPGGRFPPKWASSSPHSRPSKSSLPTFCLLKIKLLNGKRESDWMRPAESVGAEKSLKHSKKAVERLSLLWEIQIKESPALDWVMRAREETDSMS